VGCLGGVLQELPERIHPTPTKKKTTSCSKTRSAIKTRRQEVEEILRKINQKKNDHIITILGKNGYSFQGTDPFNGKLNKQEKIVVLNCTRLRKHVFPLRRLQNNPARRQRRWGLRSNPKNPLSAASPKAHKARKL